MKPAVAHQSTTRLAVVSDSVSPWNTGGKEQRNHELLTRLAKAGWQIDIYTMKWWDGPAQISRDGLTYHAISRYRPLYAGNRRSIVEAIAFALACFKLVRRTFDVVEVDAVPFLQLFSMRVVATIKRRPMLVTWHEYWGRAYWTDYLGPLGHIAATIEAVSLRLPDHIVASSVQTGQRLRKEHPRVKGVSVIPPGVDFGPERPARPPRPVPELISVGRLLAHKNVDRAIEATAVLNERGVPARLTIIGEGPELESLQRLADRESLAGQVRFLPFLAEQREMHELMADSDALLFPTVREGFGMVALEALALGVPVITSDHADNLAQYLVEDGVSGAISAPDASSLADGVERVLARREQMSRAAREAAADYDWDELARDAAEVYAR